MGTCPRCERVVGRLHPVPPEVITRDFVSDFDGLEAPTDVDVCGRCVNNLMSGRVT